MTIYQPSDDLLVSMWAARHPLYSPKKMGLFSFSSDAEPTQGLPVHRPLSPSDRQRLLEQLGFRHADAKEIAMLSSWSWQEAVFFGLGWDLLPISADIIQRQRQNDSLVAAFAKRWRWLERGVHDGLVPDSAQPACWIEVLEQAGFDFPEAIKASVEQHHGCMTDWKQEAERLAARVKSLEKRLNDALEPEGPHQRAARTKKHASLLDAYYAAGVDAGAYDENGKPVHAVAARWASITEEHGRRRTAATIMARLQEAFEGVVPDPDD